MPAAALRALLEGTIDYAGLFPPAGLALASALENQAAYVRSADAWMLGCFVLPLGKFSAAGAELGRFSRDHPLRISVLGPRTTGASEFQAAVDKAAAAIKEFSAAHAGLVSIRQFEMPLPAGANLDSLGDSLGELPSFWEVPANDASETIAALAGRGVGFKLRTGGVTAEAFPSDAEIARALVAAAKHQVAIKFTAGLHHPVKKFHEGVGTKMHGFLNVLGAGVLAAEHHWDEAQTTEMLADEDAKSFGFDTEIFRWREWTITTRQIETRRRLVTSLGSCSFDEPRDDLRAIDLL
ncbi:MAG TPA: hypothetical protein VHW03_05670 [Chthoniobacterales bacterium]|nr:hypothetical protein [Chthoniobacterales bacterium]